MVRLIKRIWLATLVFPLVTFLAWGLPLSRAGGLEGWAIGLYAASLVLIVSPLTWWGWVARKKRVEIGHGAMAGALALGVAHVLPASALLWIQLAYRGRRESGDIAILAIPILFFVSIGCAILGAAVGAGLGAVVALVQRRWERKAT